MIQSAPPPTNISPHKQTPKKYQKTNGCSHPMPLWQMLALAIMAAIEILNFDLLRPMLDLASPFLYTLFALNYLAAVLVGIDYLVLLLGDPSDPRLADPSYQENNQILVNCHQCCALVSQKSYHCNTCKRCVDEFDHHCVFLNNCIGKRNYSTFFRLLLTMLAHTTLNIAIGLSMCLSLDDSYKWVALTYALLSFVVFLEIAVLAIFHCYLSFVVYKSTLEVLRGDTKKPPRNQPALPPTRPTFSPPPRVDNQMEEQIVEEPTQMALHKADNPL